MVSKKSLFDSPLIKRENSSFLNANGSVFIRLSYFLSILDEPNFWLTQTNGVYVKRELDQGYNINVQNELEILKDRNKIWRLELSSDDSLSFDSEILNTLHSLRELKVKSEDSVLRMNEIPYSCRKLVFKEGKIEGGYTTRRFNSTIDTIDLRNSQSPSLTTSEVDRLLMDLESYNFTGDKLIRILGVNEPRSSASASAVTSLQNKGVTVETYVTDNANSFSLFYGIDTTDACRQLTGGTFYQYSDSFDFSKKIYTDRAATILAPANWYSDGFTVREWSGAIWLGSESTCTL